jgi:hypothetical protein
MPVSAILDVLSLAGEGFRFYRKRREAHAGQIARLMREAKAKFLDSETRIPRSAAYHLARLCSRTGDVEGCRRWLEASGEPGGDISRDWLETEEDLAAVLECEWFRQLLAGQAG